MVCNLTILRLTPYSNSSNSCPSLHTIVVVFGITNWIYCSNETIIDIWGIPFIILNIFDDGVNSLDNLASICMTFICTLHGIEFGFIENGFALLTLGELRILSLFCTNCPSLRPISYILSFKLFWTCSLICGCFT